MRPGRPCGGVCVSLVNARSQLVGLVTTSKKGSYRLRGLPAGRYQVEFTTSQANGYPCSGTPYAAQWYPGRAQQTAAGHVTVRAGHATRGIDAVLGHGSSITGKVSYGPQRRPVSLVCVYAYNGVDNAAFAVSDRARPLRASRAERGLVHGGLPGVRQRERAGDGGRAGPRDGGHGTPPASASGSGWAGRSTGVLRVTAGGQTSTAPGVCVVAVPVRPPGSTNYWVTGDDGSYELDNLAPGQYRVYAGDPACPFTVSGLAPKVHRGLGDRDGRPDHLGDRHDAADARRHLGRGPRRVSGQRGGPVGGICVLAEPVAPRPESRRHGHRRSTAGIPPAACCPAGTGCEFESGCGATGYPARWYPGVRRRAAGRRWSMSRRPGTGPGIDVTLPHG